MYQTKMRCDKKIPVPETLYAVMREYIRKKGLKDMDYIFQNSRGGAYYAATFCQQVKTLCMEYGLDDGFIFRPHDFRHTEATKLYDDGASLMAVRDYLGHRDENMTRRYIDLMPKRVLKKEEEYFKDNGFAKGGRKRDEGDKD